MLPLQGRAADSMLDPNDAPLAAIMHPVDEVQLWVDLSASQSCPMLLQRRAQALSAILGPLLQKFGVLKGAGQPYGLVCGHHGWHEK